MNTTLRRMTYVIFVMFLALMVATTYIQFFHAPALDADSRNPRKVYNEYGKNRGPIVVADKAVAKSTPVNDAYGYQRSYTDGPLYAPVTGFFSIVNGTTEIEEKENSYLNGQANELWLSRLTATLTGKKPQGSSVELTINPKAQEAAYKAMGNQRGAVVAIEPKTGRVLALVSTPSYDPNQLANHDRSKASAAYQNLLKADGSPLENRAIRGSTYPPGSTFKLVTAAAAIESGKYTKDSVIPAPTTYTPPQTTHAMKNFGGEVCSPTGKMTMQAALAMSCNTAFAELGVGLGASAIKAQADKFGFDAPLSIPLTVTPSYFPSDPDTPMLANAAIGQGDDRATPLQMAMVSAAIANKGVLMTPTVVSDIRDSDLRVVSKSKPKTLRTSISENTASQLTAMMEDVVSEGTGTPAQISGVKVAGKTGTAQNGTNTPHAWFTGFAPADNPQVAVAVIVEHGGSLGSEATGGDVAAPIAKAVMEAVLNR